MKANKKTKNIIYQLAILLGLIAIILFISNNLSANLEVRGIKSGFGFLNDKAGFNIIQHLIPYDESSTYLRAFLVGLLNTLLVSSIGILLATIIGFLVGIARLASNILLAMLAKVYVELLRNIPLLLQIFFWYFAVLRTLPSPRASINLFDLIFINSRGIYLPEITSNFSLLAPKLEGFNFVGGLHILPELLALLIALTVYTAAFIAEIVRAGILSVPKGQIEAAKALGLNGFKITRLIIIPQAMRVIIPPLTNQYLNLTKNSSLAAAIAYPDLVSVFAGTVLNQTGQAIEVIGITMAVYLTISLVIAYFMNLYNKRANRFV